VAELNWCQDVGLDLGQMRKQEARWNNSVRRLRGVSQERLGARTVQHMPDLLATSRKPAHHCRVNKVFAWTTPEEAVNAEVRYWQASSVEDRVSAVETIRQTALGIYDATAVRMERIYRLVVLPPRAIPSRRGTRASGQR
jgi:hypothetical protein